MDKLQIEEATKLYMLGYPPQLSCCKPSLSWLYYPPEVLGHGSAAGILNEIELARKLQSDLDNNQHSLSVKHADTVSNVEETGNARDTEPHPVSLEKLDSTLEDPVVPKPDDNEEEELLQSQPDNHSNPQSFNIEQTTACTNENSIDWEIQIRSLEHEGQQNRDVYVEPLELATVVTPKKRERSTCRATAHSSLKFPRLESLEKPNSDSVVEPMPPQSFRMSAQEEMDVEPSYLQTQQSPNPVAPSPLTPPPPSTETTRTAPSEATLPEIMQPIVHSAQLTPTPSPGGTLPKSIPNAQPTEVPSSPVTSYARRRLEEMHEGDAIMTSDSSFRAGVIDLASDEEDIGPDAIVRSLSPLPTNVANADSQPQTDVDVVSTPNRTRNEILNSSLSRSPSLSPPISTGDLDHELATIADFLAEDVSLIRSTKTTAPLAKSIAAEYLDDSD